MVEMGGPWEVLEVEAVWSSRGAAMRCGCWRVT